VGVLHEVLKRPLVPIALNTGMFWGRNAFTKKPGRAVFHILPAITEPLDAATCRKRIQHQIETASDALLNA